MLIIDALRWLVASRYPHAADECSAAAREALLDLAQQFQRELVAQGRSAYNRRIRAFLCEAVNAYTQKLEQDTGQSYRHRRELLVEVCRGLSAGDRYRAAARADLQG